MLAAVPEPPAHLLSSISLSARQIRSSEGSSGLAPPRFADWKSEGERAPIAIVDAPRRRSLRYLVPRLILLTGTLLIMEGGARLWLRFAASTEQRVKYALYEDLRPGEARVVPHPYLCYANTPGYRRGSLSHNREGFRGPEIALQKPEGVFRIVALGGSTTYTEGVADDREIFTAHLERMLRERGFGRVEVINGGVPGYNTWETLIHVCFRVLELEPDLLIVYHGTNDVHCRFVDPEAYRADNRGRRKYWEAPGLSWWQRHSTLWRIARRLRGSAHMGLEPFTNAPEYYGPYHTVEDPDAFFGNLLDQNPPRFTRDNLRNIIAIAREHEVGVLLTSWAWTDVIPGDYAGFSFYQRGFREMNELTRELAEEKGAPFFDFAAQMPRDSRYWRDGRHVNEEGSLLMARLFADYLASGTLLEAARGPAAPTAREEPGTAEEEGR